MNNLAFWQDDMDEALVGEFDGSLSNMYNLIMNVSIDFTPNGPGPHLGSSRDTTTANNLQVNNALFDSTSRNKSLNYGLNINHELHNDNSNNYFSHFKKFKPAITNEDNEDNLSNSQNRIVRQLQQIKNACFTTSSFSTNNANNGNINLTSTHNGNQSNNINNNVNCNNGGNNQSVVGSGESDGNRTSPQSSEASCNRGSIESSPDESSSRSSTVDARSPSPSSSKQKFQYVLAEPISVATKLTEDTMTYLNQGQAYEIKLENVTDVSEAKKGFMCCIINIGFYERHMQQAENELWQQWIQQHPNEKIFSVDMKLSYNVYGVEWNGMNKYEFLWDSSKAAGVFIRVNSISTEFTPKKHGGEKGIPFKLSIETFSYKPKTHDSYFISAACCQIKVFKPKGAERKIRSDKDKISKRPPSEQEKYHKSCDRTIFKECSLASLHPSADESLCYYRHSHGHFASKQVISSSNVSNTPSAQGQQQIANNQQPDEDHGNNNTDNSGTEHNQESPESRSGNHISIANETNPTNIHQRDYPSQNPKFLPIAVKSHHTDYSTSRLMVPSNSQYAKSSIDNPDNQHSDQSTYGGLQNAEQASNSNIGHSNEILPFQQPNPFNQMYHSNQVRGVASLASINNSQHFNMAYYSHTIPNSIPSHIPAPANYSHPATNPLTTISHSNLHSNHNFHIPPQQHISAKGTSSVYRNLTQHEKTISSVVTPHNTSFRASNLAITSHNSFTNYLGNNNVDHCENNNGSNPIQENSKDNNNLSTGSHYQNDNYDAHLSNNHHSTNTHNQQQQPLRQRSASLSNGHCSGYNNPIRHIENYNNLIDSNISNNSHWMGHQTTSPNSVCTQRAGSDMINQNHITNNYTGNNYDCNDNYDSDQNSPEKNHQHTSESSSSCYSRYKNNSSIVPCPQEHYELSKTDCPGQSPVITMNSNCAEVMSWFSSNRFINLTKTFNNFSGSDLLRLTKTEMIEICGLIEGIRLYNNLHNHPIKPKRVLYVCQKNDDIFHPLYLYDVTLKELLKELTSIYNSCFCNTVEALNMNEDKNQKNFGDKSSLNANSNSDSRSSLGNMSNETVGDDIYGSGEHYYGDLDQHRQGKQMRSTDPSKSSNNGNMQAIPTFDRLSIEGLTAVKIFATEQVVQLLEDESVWSLHINSSRNSGQPIEACIKACKSKRAAK